MSGRRFGAWLVLQRAASRNTFVYWLCRCDCGTESELSGSALRQGKTKSCGCKKEELRELTFTGHRETRSPTWNSWLAMRHRCANPNDPSYPRYGGRGIRVCERWESYDNFVADMGHRPEGTTLDRIDNAGNYEPGNCKWSTPSEQSRNRRSARTLTHAGLTLPLVEWAQRTGIARTAISERLRRGWTVAQALTTPIS